VPLHQNKRMARSLDGDALEAICVSSFTGRELQLQGVCAWFSYPAHILIWGLPVVAGTCLAFLYPGVTFLVSFVLNFFIWGQASSGAVPFVTIWLLICIWLLIFTIEMTGWTNGNSLRLKLSIPMRPRLSMASAAWKPALVSIVKLHYTCVLYWILLGTVCTRQAALLILLELVEFVTVRSRSGSTAAPFGPLFSICLQCTLKVLLQVVSMAAAAARRREDCLRTAEQRARASLPEDLQAALRDGKGRCPITRELMLDPVRTCEWRASRPGVHVYERHAIEEWLQTSSRSPCTNLLLEQRGLEPCVSTRNLVTRLIVAQPASLQLGCCERALDLAAEFAAATGRLLLSVCLWEIGIDADVQCIRGVHGGSENGEGGPAVFMWTGTWTGTFDPDSPPRRGRVTCAVLEVLPGVRPVAFVRGPDGQLSCSGMPRRGSDTRASLKRTPVGRAVVAYYPVILYVWIISSVVVLKLVSLTVPGHVFV